MIIAITGATGNMLRPSVKMLLNLDRRVQLRILTRNPNVECVKAWRKKYSNRIEVIKGSTTNKKDVEALIQDASYLINAAAIIPPKSDHNPALSNSVNNDAEQNIVDAINNLNPNCKLIHISTVGIYGNRNFKHPYGRVGDPLLPSVYDSYASDKLKGEYRIVHSGIKKWVILRQTGMLYPNILMSNISDGLMFHTPLNVPIEWVSDEDSSLLITNIIQKDLNNECPKFWGDIYSIGGGKAMRVTGFDTFDIGFSLMGGNAYKFIQPNWFASRNFHCFWFYDSDELEKMFHFQSETFESFFDRCLKANPIVKMGKAVPSTFIKTFLFRSLLHDSNSPMHWLKHNDINRINATFGSKEKALSIPKKFDKFPLLSKNQNPETGEYLNYEALKNPKNATLLSHGYDYKRRDYTFEDVKLAADYRGLKCISKVQPSGVLKGDDLYKKLEWMCIECQDISLLSPFSIIRAGYGCTHCSFGNPWMENKINALPFYNQVWSDFHTEDERDYISS